MKLLDCPECMVGEVPIGWEPPCPHCDGEGQIAEDEWTDLVPLFTACTIRLVVVGLVGAVVGAVAVGLLTGSVPNSAWWPEAAGGAITAIFVNMLSLTGGPLASRGDR